MRDCGFSGDGGGDYTGQTVEEPIDLSAPQQKACRNLTRCDHVIFLIDCVPA